MKAGRSFRACHAEREWWRAVTPAYAVQILQNLSKEPVAGPSGSATTSDVIWRAVTTRLRLSWALFGIVDDLGVLDFTLNRTAAGQDHLDLAAGIAHDDVALDDRSRRQ